MTCILNGRKYLKFKISAPYVKHLNERLKELIKDHEGIEIEASLQDSGGFIFKNYYFSLTFIIPENKVDSFNLKSINLDG